MTQHTPGPWEIGMRGGFNANMIFDRSGEDMHTDNAICSVFGMHMHKDISEQQDSKGLANARLIAVAPELLRELVNARREISVLHQAYIATVTNPATGLIDDPDDVLTVEADQDLLNSIDAAIAKATGDAA